MDIYSNLVQQLPCHYNCLLVTCRRQCIWRVSDLEQALPALLGLVLRAWAASMSICLTNSAWVLRAGLCCAMVGVMLSEEGTWFCLLQERNDIIACREEEPLHQQDPCHVPWENWPGIHLMPHENRVPSILKYLNLFTMLLFYSTLLKHLFY